MGLFDIFKGKGKTESPAAPVGDKNIARLGKIAGDTVRILLTQDQDAQFRPGVVA